MTFGGKSILRIFTRRTNATPVDDLVAIGEPGLFRPEVDAVHVSCSFTQDVREAERLAYLWRVYYPNVEVGGPAFDAYGEEFVPGRYLKHGYVITSRGCWNRCWFCACWRREGNLRQIPITDGWNILDNNLLQCSDDHIRGVFAMLKKQPHRAEFTGGLEAKLLKDWHVDLLINLKPKQVFFAYDEPSDLEPLMIAGRKLREAGFPMHPQSHALRCYVLIGYPKDTIENAENRMKETLSAGFTPAAMLWDEYHKYFSAWDQKQWREFQRQYIRPAIIHSKDTAAK